MADEIRVGAGDTLRVTVIDCGLLDTLVELTCTVPVYWPAVRLLAKMETVMVPGVVPLEGDAESHAAPCVTEVVKDTAAPPEALTDTPCEDGSEPRSTMLKVSEPVERISVGAGETTNETGMLTGLLVAPAELTEIDPL